MTSIRIDDKTDNCGDRLLLERSHKNPDTHVFLHLGCATTGQQQGIFVPLVELRAALDKIEANA